MRPTVIVVVGSAMMDLTAYADVLPEPGQTLAGQLFTTGLVARELTKRLWPPTVELAYISLEN